LLSKLYSAAIFGVEAFMVEIEVDIHPGLPSFNIVGLPDTAVQESRERVRAAIKNSEFEFPMQRITVNLAPADIKKKVPFLTSLLLWQFWLPVSKLSLTYQMNI